MIEHFISLLESYLDNDLADDKFAREYLILWRQLRDYHSFSTDSQNIALELRRKLSLGLIDKQEFIAGYTKSIPEADSSEYVHPFSEADIIIEELFYVVEAYNPDSVMDAHSSSSEQLHDGARNALTKLQELQQ